MYPKNLLSRYLCYTAYNLTRVQHKDLALLFTAFQRIGALPTHVALRSRRVPEFKPTLALRAVADRVSVLDVEVLHYILGVGL